MMASKPPHLCEGMEGALDGKTALIYRDRERSYEILAHPDTKGNWTHVISHCPFCGVELPTDLSSEWYEQAKEFEIDGEINIERVPHELKSGEWWRKDDRYRNGT